MADFSTTFTQANGAPDANWNIVSFGSGTNWQINSNQLQTPGEAFPAPPPHVIETTTAAHVDVSDCEVSVKWSATAGLDGGPLLRKVSGSTHTYYYADVNGANTIEVYRTVAGTDTSLGQRNPGTNHAVGDIFALRAVGSTLQVKRNGVQVGADITDSVITAGGRTGILMWSGSVLLDDFSMTDLGAGGVSGEGMAKRPLMGFY